MARTTLPPRQIWAPEFAEVFEDSISGNDYMRVQKRCPPDLLERFCSIVEAADIAAAVVKFAKAWGTLGLCEHGLPYGHRRSYCKPNHRESFQHWKENALCLDSMLRIGLDLNRRKPGERVNWQLVLEHLAAPGTSRSDIVQALNFNQLPVFIGEPTIHDISEFMDSPEGTFPPTFSTLSRARMAYMTVMGRLIEDAQIRPWFHWRGGGWNVDTEPVGQSNLPGILTAQVMLRVSSAKTQIKCSACPRWFIPKRNQRKYCDHCGIQAAWRDAQQRRRRK